MLVVGKSVGKRDEEKIDTDSDSDGEPRFSLFRKSDTGLTPTMLF